MLLDTHIMLWIMADVPPLSGAIRQKINRAREVYVSPVSIWEVSTKTALGKLKIDQDRLMEILPAVGFRSLPVTWEHADAVRRLPPIHRDPFDRLLVAQALSEPLRLITADKLLAEYSELVDVV